MIEIDDVKSDPDSMNPIALIEAPAATHRALLGALAADPSGRQAPRRGRWYSRNR
jgi:hypothetical protein